MEASGKRNSGQLYWCSVNWPFAFLPFSWFVFLFHTDFLNLLHFFPLIYLFIFIVGQRADGHQHVGHIKSGKCLGKSLSARPWAMAPIYSICSFDIIYLGNGICWRWQRQFVWLNERRTSIEVKGLSALGALKWKVNSRARDREFLPVRIFNWKANRAYEWCWLFGLVGGGGKCLELSSNLISRNSNEEVL